MAAYVVDVTYTASTSASLATWVAGASRPRRLKFYQIIFGTNTTPGDNALELLGARITAAGTNSSVTIQPLDPADFATESTAGQNNTIEPTYTSNLNMIHIALNTRATVIWTSRERGEIITPATASNGLGFKMPVAGGTPGVRASIYAEEL